MAVLHRPIRVANIIEDGRLAGPQIRMINVASALSPNYETTIVMPERNSSEFQKRCDKYSVPYKMLPITRITIKDRIEALRYLIFFVHEIFLISRFLKKKQFDLVHVSGGSWQIKGLIAAKIAKTKVIWHLNDSQMPSIVRLIFKFLSNFSDGFIYASSRSYKYYCDLAPKSTKTVIIQAPVDINQFDPNLYFIDDDGDIPNLEKSIVVGTVANINPVKGFELIIKAAAILNQKKISSVFLILGPVYEPQRYYYKKLQELCEKLAVDNIYFVGSRSDVRPLLSRFDIYICSSSFESSPISVWEAMSMAKPVVSTDVGDVSRFVREDHNGYIVQVGDEVAFADKISRLIVSKERRRLFGEKSREIVRRELSLEKCVKKHMDFYMLVLGDVA